MITGVVTGTGGIALASIEVALAPSGSDDSTSWATTASDGTYTAGVPAGVYTVRFFDESGTYLNGYYSSGYSGHFTLDHSLASLVDASSSNVTGIDVQLATGHNVKGTVTGTGGAALSNVEVDVYSDDYSGSTWTAAGGTYSVDVPTGTYTVAFWNAPEPYTNGYYSISSPGAFTADRTAATPLSVGSSDVTGINVQLAAGHYIEGIVTAPGGAPLANVEVDAWSSAYQARDWATADDGTYSVLVAAGSYKMSFTDNTGAYLNGYYSSGSSGHFTLVSASATLVDANSSDVTGINVQLGTGYHLKGKVHALGGAPLEGIGVGPWSSSYSGSVMTASDGTYSVAVPAGTYLVKFWSDWLCSPVGCSMPYLSGYYSSGGFVIDQALATAIPVGASDVTGIDVTLWPAGATYHALTPTRLLDTRDGTGGLGVFSSHVHQTFAVTGHGGVPSSATAVTGNLTVTGQTSLGFLYLGPNANNNPTSSTLNFPMNDDRANGVTVALDGNGKLSITYAAPTLGPTAHVIFDVTGYFTADSSGARYVPLTPMRFLDSRDGTGLSGASSSHAARPFQVTGFASVPNFAMAVTGNLTVTGQTSLGFLYLGPNAQDNPTSSTLNFPMNDDRANGVTVALAGNGKLSITYAAPTSGPTAHVIFDVTGYFVEGG